MNRDIKVHGKPIINKTLDHHQSGRVYNGTCPEDKTMGDHTVGVTGPT